ncbi:MAG: phosphate ABC transporter permease subunit PstC [Planctomycetota bacterium]
MGNRGRTGILRCGIRRRVRLPRFFPFPAAADAPGRLPGWRFQRDGGGRTSIERAGDRAFRRIVLFFGLGVVALAGIIAWKLVAGSHLAIEKFGLSFLWTSTWDPVQEQFGALPFIYGTIVSSAIALLLAIPLGVGSAVFLVELAPSRVSGAVSFMIELLAAVPSVIIGLMGIFLLVPAVRAVEPFLTARIGFLPLFRGEPYGVGMLTAGIILAVMILPYITSVSREVLLAVPRPLKEASLALGATRWEMVRQVSLPCARSGIFAAILLALGRALGETMAVTMVIGNTPNISASLLDPAYSMAAVIANEFAEATGDVHLHALIYIGLCLFALGVVVNGAGRLIVYRFTIREGAGR